MASKTKNKKADPLSRYFKDLNESDLDSDSEDENENESNDGDASPSNSNLKKSNASSSEPPHTQEQEHCDVNESETPPLLGRTVSSTPVKLPSARQCLEKKNEASFLKLNEKREIDWDHSHKRLDNDGNEQDQIIDYKSNAVPPPSSYEPVTDPGIKVVDSEGRKRKTKADDLEDQKTSCKAYKVERQQQPETDDS